MYKQSPDSLIYGKPLCIIRLLDNAVIPFAPDNTDYQQFRKDIANGAELQDSTGTVMTASQIQAFIATLP